MPRLGDMTALALAACLPMPVFTRKNPPPGCSRSLNSTCRAVASRCQSLGRNGNAGQISGSIGPLCVDCCKVGYILCQQSNAGHKPKTTTGRGPKRNVDRYHRTPDSCYCGCCCCSSSSSHHPPLTLQLLVQLPRH